MEKGISFHEDTIRRADKMNSINKKPSIWYNFI